MLIRFSWFLKTFRLKFYVINVEIRFVETEKKHEKNFLMTDFLKDFFNFLKKEKNIGMATDVSYAFV